MAVRAWTDEAYICVYMEIWGNGKKDYQMILHDLCVNLCLFRHKIPLVEHNNNKL